MCELGSFKPNTCVDTSTVLNLEEENMNNSVHHTCSMMVPVPVVFSDTCI